MDNMDKSLNKVTAAAETEKKKPTKKKMSPAMKKKNSGVGENRRTGYILYFCSVNLRFSVYGN